MEKKQIKINGKITVEIKINGGLFWKAGGPGPVVEYEYVDLGLPSGLKWAKCNIGAKKETDYGDHFMWGSTEPNNYTKCDWPTAPFNNGSSDYNATYFNSVKDTVCPNGILAKEYDAASHIMGGDWRMPTQTECQELINKTTNEWTQVNGVNGYKFTSKTNGNSIFIPAESDSGSVWSSSLRVSGTDHAWDLFFNSNYCNWNSTGRCYGQSVRGVRK